MDVMKWINHEKSEWIVYSLNKIPKFLKHNLNVKDKTQISNFRKAIDLYIQLDQIGFIEDLRKHQSKLTRCLDVKEYPFEGFEEVSLSEGLIGTTFSYLIISALKVICTYLKDSDWFDKDEEKENMKLREEILKLINELKKSKISLSLEHRIIFEKPAEEIILELKY